MHKYVYEGPVMVFENCVTYNWKGETCAVSEAKARSNLAYQFKRQCGRVSSASSVKLPGKIKMVY